MSSIRDLEAGFHDPPAEAKPRVWWHWMNGNVTPEGVRLDLEWMKRIGIGGVQHVDAAFEWGLPFDTPPRVDKPFAFLTPEWRRAFRDSVGLAHELGLEFTINSSAGWSISGGPQVKPHGAMKKLVWSETWVPGGVPFKDRLAQPPMTTGLFQNIPLLEMGDASGEGSDVPAEYDDITTMAYRVAESEVAPTSLGPSVTSSAGPIDAARLMDGDLSTAVSLPFGEVQPAWIQFSYAVPQRIQALTAVIGPPMLGMKPVWETREGGRLEWRDERGIFQPIIDLPRSGAPQQTVAFSPIVAQVFRVILDRPELTLFERAGLAVPPTAHRIAQLVLHTGARVNRFEDKAGFSTRQILASDDTPAVGTADVIQKDDFIDLTDRMRADGSLDWTPPAGRWLVLRWGCSLTGRRNAGASRAGTGLEVDKLNRAHVKAYIDEYLDEFEKMLGPELVGRQGLSYVLMDSFEAGAQNWTTDLFPQFRQRRGYDAYPWLAVLAGRVVVSAEASDRFLWDFRHTLGELLAESHYAQIGQSLHERGLGLYSESHEYGRAFIGDGMQVKKTADIPMGAVWAATPPGVAREDYDADIRESASVAHLYGKPLVAGESFTTFPAPDALYGFSPEILKPFADRAMAMGLNRFCIHCAVHQPDTKPGPGMGMGPFGQWFTRHETWAEQSVGWIGYLTRSSYLLQQGRFVADIAYLYGEDANVTSLFRAGAMPPIPDGYDFDFVNPDALLREFSVGDGRLRARGGMQYRALMLDASTSRLSLPLLRKIRDLVQDGAMIVGAKPSATPSLADDEAEFRAIVAQLWAEKAGAHAFGAGTVHSVRTLADVSLSDVLRALDIAPDVTFVKRTGALPRVVHRTFDDGDLYFVSNATAQLQMVEASFRVSGMAPELWRADTATIERSSFRMESGRTIVPLTLDPHDAVFVVFRRPTREQHAAIPDMSTQVLTTLQGPWAVCFPADLGAPVEARFDTLVSWTQSRDAGVKYFAGTASYHNTLHVRAEWLSDRSRVQLDLGAVKNLAQVFINRRSLGVLWKPPFRLDITDALQTGSNRIELQVTNLWPNRLIGDKQPGAHPIAFANFDPFTADTQLLPSGLLGPVTVLRVALPSR